jgi:hypothetical protein
VQNGGGHPWTIAQGTDSTLLLFNHSLDGPKKFEVLIGNGKQLWVGSYKLASMETKAVKINEIVEKQIPDATGTKLSKDILTGQVGWWTHRATWGKGRLMVSQAQSGMARSFSCGTCANLCSRATVSPDDSATIIIGFTNVLGNAAFQQCLATCGECGGTVQGPADETPTWSSLNTSIATVYSGQFSPMATFKGVAPGLTTGQVQAIDEACTAQGRGPITVQPSITSLDPNPIMIGTSPPDGKLTINGSGFGTSPTVNLPSGVTSTGQGSTDTQIILTGVNVALSATVGNNNITVTASGQKSPPASLTVDGPYHMLVQSDVTGLCSGCATTVKRTVWYQIQNFSGSNAGTTQMGENGSDGSSSCTPNSLPSFTSCTSNFNSLSNGTFGDVWSMNSDSYVPSGCGFTTTDHWQWCVHSPAQTLDTLTLYIPTNSILINCVLSPSQMAIGTVVPF